LDKEPTITGRINNLDPEPQYLMPDGRKPLLVIAGDRSELMARLMAMDFSAIEDRVVLIDSYPDEPIVPEHAMEFRYMETNLQETRRRERMERGPDPTEKERVPNNRKQRRKENSKKGGAAQTQVRKGPQTWR
jgi:hypothetical protein